MSERAWRDPQLDEWRDKIAEEVRAFMARDRLSQSDAARAMKMHQRALSRRLAGEVSFSAEELYWLADWMNRNIDEILAAAKARTTNPCLSYSDQAAAERWTWARRGYDLAAKLYGMATPRAA
jgi:transcriptional regulator with XRE-family HTH domain